MLIVCFKEIIVQDLVQLEHSNRKTTSNRSLKITHGEVVIDRKSIFQVHAALITPVEQVKTVCRAARLVMSRVPVGCIGGVEVVKSAGSVMVTSNTKCRLNQATGATNVTVVVSRWRGGVNIGPDRFRHIHSVASQGLLQLGLVKKK
ncbi:protein IMPACT homolog [Homalodisca vitripennis]|uniref:protein IMPACT homolog n=1 Tax=Homalodisca vitripennis TaxID=197043 RepID=UPI001EEB444A|nr:protein IMPACT homolog [Homalodisca vitripennis]